MDADELEIVRVVRAPSAYDDDGKPIAHKFVGYTSLNKCLPIDAWWIRDMYKDSFPSIYESLLVNNLDINEETSIELNAASSRICKNTRQIPVRQSKHWPVVYCRQQQSEACMFASAISAFRAIGDNLMADTLLEGVSLSLSPGYKNRLALLTDYVTGRYRKAHDPKLGYSIKKFKASNPESLQVLSDISPYPTVCVLENNFGGTLHSVTIVGNWIFDSNFAHAFPLSIMWLDYLSDYRSNGAIFSKIHEAIRCYPPKKFTTKMKYL